MLRTQFRPTANDFKKAYAKTRTQVRPIEVLYNKAFNNACLTMTPNANSSCKKPGCSGLVIKNIVAVAGVPIYGAPHCNICGKLYLSTHLVTLLV